VKFEDVITTLDISKFEEMSTEELGLVVQKLRAIRTDVPETKHRRKKYRSRDYLVRQLMQMAEGMKRENPAFKDIAVQDIVAIIMKQPQLMEVLAEQEESEEEAE